MRCNQIVNTKSSTPVNRNPQLLGGDVEYALEVRSKPSLGCWRKGKWQQSVFGDEIRDGPKGLLAGQLGSFGQNLTAAAQAFRFLFRSLPRWNTVLNPHNLLYYVCFGATPPPAGADVLYVWPLNILGTCQSILLFFINKLLSHRGLVH